MRHSALLILFLTAVLAGCSSAPKNPPVAVSAPARTLPSVTPSDSSQILGNDVVFQAFSLVGTPYRWGGTSPETGFDCSGLIQ